MAQLTDSQLKRDNFVKDSSSSTKLLKLVIVLGLLTGLFVIVNVDHSPKTKE